MSYEYRVDYLVVPAPVAVVSTVGQAVPTYARIVKRAVDLLIVALVCLPVLAVLLILGAIVALDGHSPLYFQNRVGRGERVFRLFKLRTMVPNADAVLEQALIADPAARSEWEKFQKLRNDPRITAIGRLLRKMSLDELPQVINVARGEMSIVGPRPIMESQQSIYPGTEYYHMRPGITGFWQVSVRNESSFSERAQFDRSYFNQMSFATDLRVIAKTFRVVLKGTGV